MGGRSNLDPSGIKHQVMVEIFCGTCPPKNIFDQEGDEDGDVWKLMGFVCLVCVGVCQTIRKGKSEGKLPSRELTYPTLEKENHRLKSAGWDGIC